MELSSGGGMGSQLNLNVKNYGEAEATSFLVLVGCGFSLADDNSQIRNDFPQPHNSLPAQQMVVGDMHVIQLLAT